MPDTIKVTRLLSRKRSLGDTQVRVSEEHAALGAGEALLRIDRLALTTNNITYAAFGDAMQYWAFFPTGDADFGHMPAWGFAEVVASTAEGVAPGERFYGYFPVASHLRVKPARTSPRGFYDGSAHRLELTSAYNQYMRCSTDPAYDRAREDAQALLRPLFITSFMLADYLQDNAFFGASQLVFSSASSKTAYGTAFCLAEQPGIERIALTSPGHRAFVEGLGCYARTAAYDALETIAPDRPTLYVDFSGDEALRAAVHRHFGAALRHDCFAGSAQNTQFLRDTGLPGPAPQFFFAPVQIRKRNADWGHERVNRQFNEAQRRFIECVTAPPAPWLQVKAHYGFEAAGRLVADLHGGRADPHFGHVVVLN